MDDNIKQFITELRDLMKKHNVSDIGVDIEGDTQGMMTDFTVEMAGKEHIINAGSAYLDNQDIKDFLKD
jgi:hypothetical protein